MSALIFALGLSLFTGSIFCGVCYGIAIRDYRDRRELGHPVKSPYCRAPLDEAERFLLVGAATYLIGLAMLSSTFWQG